MQKKTIITLNYYNYSTYSNSQLWNQFVDGPASGSCFWMNLYYFLQKWIQGCSNKGSIYIPFSRWNNSDIMKLPFFPGWGAFYIYKYELFWQVSVTQVTVNALWPLLLWYIPRVIVLTANLRYMCTLWMIPGKT